MSANPKIFISTVTKELKSARELVAKTLHFLGFDPVYQEEFGSPTDVLRSALDDKLKDCVAVIQLVGHRYGWDVKDAANPAESMSYTHYEAHYAHLHKLPIWYLIVGDGYAVDNPNDEDAEKKALQLAYRIKVQRTGHLYHRVADIKDVELTVFRMLPYLDELRATQYRWIRHVPADNAAPLAAVATSGAANLSREEIEKTMRNLLTEFVPVLQQARQTSDAEEESRREEVLYTRLGSMLGVSAQEARKQIEGIATKLKGDTTKSLLERADAAYALKDYANAEKLALEATEQAKKQPSPDVDLQIEAFEMAADAARQQIHYAAALDHCRAAEHLTDRARNPIQWADTQYMIAVMLNEQGIYLEAAQILRPVVALREAVLGAEHPETLDARNNFANALHFQGKHAEAEAEHRTILEIRQRVLGTEHSDTLSSRNNLALALNGQGKDGEAEKEHRASLEIRQRLVGIEHPDTLSSLNNLASALTSQGKYADAEKEQRAILEIYERVFGPEHPDTLKTRNNLGNSLRGQGKHAEAEQEHRATLEIRRRLLGKEHPDTLSSCYNLSLCLAEQGKKNEALELVRCANQGWCNGLGTDHPHTKMSQALLARLEKAP
jgi:hypothetical protein